MIVLRWEHKRLSSVALKLLRWQSIAWGIIFAALLIWIYSLLGLAMAFAGVPWFTEGLSGLAIYPLWCLVLAILIGAGPRHLYCGYTIERLTSLTGSYWIAGLTSVFFSGLAHVPVWDWPAALKTVVSGMLVIVFSV